MKLEDFKYASRQYDPEQGSEAGVNIELQLPRPISGEIDKAQMPITLNLSDVPIQEALRYVTELAGLKYKVEKHAIIVAPVSVNSE